VQLKTIRHEKTIHLCILLFVCFCKYSNAQVLCIYCYNQIDSISSGVNNLLLNGSFENGCAGGGYFCPNSSQYSCNLTHWVCTGGGDSTYAQIWNNILTIVPEGNIALYFGNQLCRACSPLLNDTSCLIKDSCTIAGIPAGYPLNTPGYGGINGVNLKQTVTGLIIGNIYVLEFWAGGEFLGGNPYEGLFALDVGFGNTFLKDKSSPPATGTGTRYIVEFIATSSSHTIKFTNWGHICQGCTELVLDDVRLYTLAELSPIVPPCPTTINENHENAFVSIYPNPITNNLTIKAKNSELSEIILYDIASRKILQEKFTNSVSINTEQLAKGLYLYEVRNQDGSCKKGKVVKN